MTVAGELVELTAKEFDLLAWLVENPGIVFSRDQLLDRVWGMTFEGGTRTVDVHVAQLRRKLGRPELIRTVRGSGYKAVRDVIRSVAAGAAVRGDRDRRGALRRARARDRRPAHAPRASSGTRSATSAHQADLLAERERDALLPSRGDLKPASRSSTRQGERVVCAQLDGSSPYLPAGRGARAAARRAARRHASRSTASATSTPRGSSAARRFVLLRPTERRPRRRGGRTSSGLLIGAGAAAALAALAAFLLARAISRPSGASPRPRAALAHERVRRSRARSRARASSRSLARVVQRDGGAARRRRARPSARSCSRSATS